MSTSELVPSPSAADRKAAASGIGAVPTAEIDVAVAMAGEIHRIANELFSAAPEGALGPGGHPAASASVGLPGVSPGWVSPPNWGPSALGIGAGSVSPALSGPPVPGPLKQPTLPVAPLPKDSDLRVIPGVLSDSLGIASPTTVAAPAGGAAADPSTAPESAFYFLQIAGLPSATTVPHGLPDAPAPEPPDPRAFSFQAIPVAAAPAGAAAASSRLAQEAAGIRAWAPAEAAAPSPRQTGEMSRPDAYAARAELPPAARPPGSTDFWPELVADLDTLRPLFDGHTIKKDFPILRERVNGRPIVWLDNAATTQKPQVVIDRLARYYEHENSNVHRAAHALAARATDAYESARDTVRRFLNAPTSQEIVFLRGTTEAINLVAKSWGERYVGAGDEIVITWLEHHANIVPWQQLCADKGACLKVAPVDRRGQVLLDQYEKLLGPRTRLVSFSHVSNVLGTIVPAREMIEMAHRHGAIALVDGAQAVSHLRVDVQALDCDFYCFSGHKMFAPTGIGALYGKRDLLESMPPWQGGGNMISNVTFEKTTYQPAPARFEAGTGSIGDAVGLGAALDYVSALSIENIGRYEHNLLDYATEGLARVRGLQMIGTAPDKAGVLSFVLDGVRAEDVGAALNQQGIAVRAGHHCAQPILRRYGLESTVRASLAPYNTRDDIDELVAALQRLQSGRPVARNAT